METLQLMEYNGYMVMFIIKIQMKVSLIVSPGCILLLGAIFIVAHGASYTYTSCNSSSYLNTANLQCYSCQNNSVPNLYQVIPISCQCTEGYSPSTNGSCTTSASCSTSNSYYPIYTLNGNANSGSTNCVACASNAFSNNNGTACTPCGTGMTYSTSQGCMCTNTNNIRTDLGCFFTSISPSVTTSSYSDELKYLIPGCANFSDYLSCSQMLNLCAYSQGSATAPECQFFSTYSLTSMLYASSSAFSLTPSQSSTISLKLITYSSTGNYLGEQSLILGDIMRCGIPSNSEVGVVFGTNIQATCSFNFNNLITQMQSKQYQGHLYQMLVQGDDQGYYDVPVYMSGATSPIRRFFLEDSFTFSNKINVLTAFTLQFTFSGGKITSPNFTPTYTLLSTEAGSGVVGQSSTITLSFNVLFNSDLSGFWIGAVASFIVISLLAVLHTVGKTYVGYLNRKSPLLFFLNFTGVYSLWLFYYLLFMTGYWFLFTKTTSSPYLLLPAQDPSLYPAFYSLVAVMVILRLLWALIEKADRLNTQVYLINWEKGQFRNSWREIFIVNSLAEFYTYRTISLFWMLAVLLFFMTGVGWEQLAAETTSATTTFYTTLTPQNRLLLYFLASAVFLAIGIAFKLLRRLSVLFWPYPFQDFVDYCTVTNISFVFIKRRAPHAYYLHAALPDQTDVTYREINEAIRRGLQKNRSIGSEVSLDSLKVYSLYLNRDLEDRHTHMLKKIEEQEHTRRMKYTKESQKKQKLNFREEFVERHLKPQIEGMASSQNNQHRKTFFQNFCGTPPIDLRQDGGRNQNLVFFDQSLELLNEVFPNGNEFQEIHTLIVIFLGWITLVNSTPIAAFLTYFVDQYIIGAWVSWSCRNSLQEMTKVKRGFMI